MVENGKSVTDRSTFGRTTSVSIIVRADAGIVWQLLTNCADYPRWNSTVISIEGKIAAGETIRLKSVLAPERTFKLKVREYLPEKLLAWGDGQGLRVYQITRNDNQSVAFSMKEKIGGLMFPLYAKHIPSFDQAFEQFAADIKREAEAIQNLKI